MKNRLDVLPKHSLLTGRQRVRLRTPATTRSINVVRRCVYCAYRVYELCCNLYTLGGPFRDDCNNNNNIIAESRFLPLGYLFIHYVYAEVDPTRLIVLVASSRFT